MHCGELRAGMLYALYCTAWTMDACMHVPHREPVMGHGTARVVDPLESAAGIKLSGQPDRYICMYVCPSEKGHLPPSLTSDAAVEAGDNNNMKACHALMRSCAHALMHLHSAIPSPTPSHAAGRSFDAARRQVAASAGPSPLGGGASGIQ